MLGYFFDIFYKPRQNEELVLPAARLLQQLDDDRPVLIFLLKSAIMGMLMNKN